MPTCGYICPQCEGKELLEDGTPCNWCSALPDSSALVESPPQNEKEDNINLP